MCTVSWVTRPDGYELFCNRDERRSRRAARAPALRTSRGVRFVAPTDAEAGGTWIAVNEHGLTLCLLNRYAGVVAPAGSAYRSRGLLLPDLIGHGDTAEVMRAIARTALSPFQPFTLLALAPGAEPSVAGWTGERLLISEEDCDSLMPLTSSSFASGEVARARRELFRDMAAAARPTADLLVRFQRSHHPEPGPYSVCMHRADASTVSSSRVTVTPHSVDLFYRPGPPCEGGPGTHVFMPRARRVARPRGESRRSVSIAGGAV